MRINEHMLSEISHEYGNEDTLYVGVDASVKNGVIAGHVEMRGYLIE